MNILALIVIIAMVAIVVGMAFSVWVAVRQQLEDYERGKLQDEREFAIHNRMADIAHGHKRNSYAASNKS